MNQKLKDNYTPTKYIEDKVIGNIYNKWEVIRYDKARSNKERHTYYWCKCLDCNNEFSVLIDNIVHNKSKSCGCKSHYKSYSAKLNEYYIDKNNPAITHVLLLHDKEMICDTEDWENLKQYYWWQTKKGYVQTRNKDIGCIKFQRIVMKVTNSEDTVDHINGNILDNRKENLRVCTNQKNLFNRGINKNNKSGYKGVSYDKSRDKWVGSIYLNRKHIAKRFDTKEEAHEWYMIMSNSLYKEYSVYNSREEKDINRKAGE